MTSNNRLVASAALAASLFAPMFALAAETGTVPSRQVAQRAAADLFCERVLAADSAAPRRMEMMMRGVVSSRLQRSSAREDKREAREEALTAIRERQDTHLEAIYDKLDEGNATDAEKAALADFKVAVADAVAARRAAVDAANEAMQDGVAAVRASRQAAVDEAVSDFKSAVDASAALAKADCAKDGADSAKIREAYMKAIQDAKDDLTAARQPIDKMSEGVKPLIEAHRAALEKALADFKAALDKAKSELKASYDIKKNVK